jgi:ribonucleoside-diphosphate reductase alpha chain
MGVLRVDHPDIEEFVRAKSNRDKLTNFNISVAITDKFMECVDNGMPFPLVFNGQVYSHINASNLWDEIMRATWDWAEPGVLFIDAINRNNNLWNAETIAATNPCAEQPLPPNGACLLGSLNLTKYVDPTSLTIDTAAIRRDIPSIVRAMDNVVDRAVYPLPEQEKEAKDKRRMGLGYTGVANAIEALDRPYASPLFLATFEGLMKLLVNEAYRASALLAKEKGPFPLWNLDDFRVTETCRILDDDVTALIEEHGLRNSHLISIAPTGTISLCADNVSSGIEPVFSYGYDRTINMPSGVVVERVDDYGVRVFGVRGKTADKCTVDEHLSVLLVAQKWTDSAVSKTCNVGADVSFDDFKDIYTKAWRGGAKGCTTFRAAGKRMGILMATKDEPEAPKEDFFENTDERQIEMFGAACFIDPTTGKKTCD